MSEIEHPNLAVMFTDIKGYSRIMSEDEIRALQLLAEHDEMMGQVVADHGGRVVKKLGDAYMVIFQATEDAVHCGLKALSRIAARNRESSPAMEIRVGLHAGAMLERDGDFFGENVNIAARLEQMARPMTIAASERVVQDIATRVPAEARFVGAQALKNLRYPVSVYQLVPADSWKLYLSGESATADAEAQDVLKELADGEQAWQRFEQLILEGDLHTACRLAEAALSRFGGTYDQYAHLAACYLLARMESEAQSALRLGDMLGQKGPEAEQYDWVQALAELGEEFTQRPRGDLSECLARANEYVTARPHDLPMRVLVESLKAKVSGHLAGLAALAQQHPNSALVLRGYAEALKDQHRGADAQRLLEQTVAAAPHVADHQLRRMQWMLDNGDFDAVREESDVLARRFAADPRVYEWTGKVRLLAFDPHGAQWIFEQDQQAGAGPRTDALAWLICCLSQQGRFESAVDRARKEMRHAIRQNRQKRARHCLHMAALGLWLQHWDGVLEVLDEYRRYDSHWAWPQALAIGVKHALRMIPWDRVLNQVGELALASGRGPYPHPSGLTVAALLPCAQDAREWSTLRGLEFYHASRDWIIERHDLSAAIGEARCALQFAGIEPWHGQLVPVLTHPRHRLDHRLPALLALAGLIEARLERFDAARPLLEQSRKLWRSADWMVWEIQEAEAVLAAGPAPVAPRGA
jgi:class 3 adenylate cyclase